MILIKDYSEISPLIREYFKAGMVTNNFMKEEDYKRLISDNALYYFKWNGGVLFFKKRQKDFLCLYQIVDLNSSIEKFDIIEIPVVVEIVSKENDSKTSAVKDFFEKLGFNIVLNRIRMKKIEDVDVKDELQVKIIAADISQTQAIYDFLNSIFDIHTGCVPTKEVLNQDVLDRKVLIAVNEDNRITGVLHFEIEKSKAEIRHLAIEENNRNKGIASALINRFHELTQKDNSHVWVASDNMIAQKTYLKNGYAIDNYKSIVMIKGEDK